MNNPHLIRDIEIDRLKSEKEQFKQRAELLNLHNEKWVQKIRDQEAELVSLRSQLQTAMEERDNYKTWYENTKAHYATLQADLATANSRLEEAEKAAGLMFETVDARRSPDALQDRADLLIKRGWTPIPFTPEGAPEGFTAKITHPYQKWQKLHHMNKITEQALKIELREDTDNLRALLFRLSTSRETERKTK